MGRAWRCWPGRYFEKKGGDVRRPERYVCGPCRQPPDPQHMGTATRPAKTAPAPWDAFSDVDAFVDEVLVELAAMAADGTRPTRPGPKPALAGAELRKAIMAIWCTGFCGMQGRAISQLSGIPFGTLHTLFARWTRLGLWRRLLDRLRRTWRLACGDTPEPSTLVIDSRSCRSAPSLLHARHRRRQEDQGHQDPDRGREVRHPAGDRRVASEYPRHQGHHPGAARAGWPGFPGTRLGRSRLPRQAAGQGRRGARHPHRAGRPRPRRQV